MWTPGVCGRDAGKARFNMRVSCVPRIKQSTDVRSNSSPHTHTHPAFISSSSDAAGLLRPVTLGSCRILSCTAVSTVDVCGPVPLCAVDRSTASPHRPPAPARDLSAFDLLRQSVLQPPCRTLRRHPSTSARGQLGT